MIKDEEVRAIPCLICARFIKNAGIEKVVNRFEEVLAKDNPPLNARWRLKRGLAKALVD